MTHSTLWSEQLQIVGGHMLVERGGRLAILDTGVPESMPCPRVVSDVLGVQVDRLIGCTELARSPLQIDWANRRIIHDAAPQAGAVCVPLTRVAFGIPCIPMETHLGRVQAVLDTGAALSYAPPEAVDGLVPVRRAEDFLPGFGRFTVDVYRLELSVGGITLSVEFGVLPPLLRAALTLLCPSAWILGSELFRDRVVTLDLARSIIHLSPATATEETGDDVLPEHDRPDESMASADAPPAAVGQVDSIAYSLRIDATRRRDDEVRLRAVITLSGTARTDDRPVQLALVLDRSGSMKGTRLDAVRDAARAAVRLLPGGSTIGLVTYAHSATIELPLRSGALATIASMDVVLDRLTAAGGTALADGWRAGWSLLAGDPARDDAPSSHGMLRRVLLVSDGHANVGERSPDMLGEWCARAAAAGVTTSTVGVGHGYDEDLLRAMAIAGGGSTWYVATPGQATEVLAEEVRAMRTISALDTTMRVTPAAGVELVAVHGGHEDVRSPSPRLRGTALQPVRIGELSGAAERTVIVEFVVPAARVGNGPVALGSALVQAVNPGHASEIRLTIELAWDGQVIAQPIARRAWLRLRIASARLAAVRSADAGRHHQAAAHLRRVIAFVERQPGAVVGQLSLQLEELRRLARRLEGRTFDAKTRKHTLQRADNALTGKEWYDRGLRFS